MAVMESEDWGSPDAMSDGEITTVSAICNRVSRMLGLLDREGLQQDISIVQAKCPLDLEALLSSRDKVFVEELLTIVDSTDRTTGSLKGGYRSRFALDDLPGRFI